MKSISKTVTPLFLAVILTACNGIVSTPTMSPKDLERTAISFAKTAVAMTRTAIPTITPIPSIPILPTRSTAMPPTATRVPLDTYADKIDYAMTIAPTIYNLLPFINKATPYGEYSGCTKTYDFHNFVGYPVMHPIEIVNTAFLNYFSTENWEFTEATSELVNYNIPRITYDVFRISSKGKPSFERLKVILTDESAVRGKDHIEVRAELTHVETKENLQYLLDPLTCYYSEEAWLWIRLYK